MACLRHGCTNPSYEAQVSEDDLKLWAAPIIASMTQGMKNMNSSNRISIRTFLAFFRMINGFYMTFFSLKGLPRILVSVSGLDLVKMRAEGCRRVAEVAEVGGVGLQGSIEDTGSSILFQTGFAMVHRILVC